jgi:hypothetical protein
VREQKLRAQAIADRKTATAFVELLDKNETYERIQDRKVSEGNLVAFAPRTPLS